MILRGKNLIIKAGGAAIAAAKACSIDIQSEDIEVSSPLTGSWKTFISGRKSWKIDVSGLVTTNLENLPQNLRNLKSLVGTYIDVEVSIEPDAGMIYGLLQFDDVQDTSVDVQSVGLTAWPDKIYWNDELGKFVGLKNGLYYDTWAGGQSYMEPSEGSYFATKDDLYQIENEYLVEISETLAMSGQALCKSVRVSGQIKNLSVYSMQMLGNGELE